MEPIAGFWIMAPDRLLAVLDATPQGIAAPEVKRRPASLGRNVVLETQQRIATRIRASIAAPILVIFIIRTAASA